jgi:formate hydrogenlyase transcriptional activator
MFPLKIAMRHIGTIYFGTYTPHTYYDDEIRFLSLVAGTIGMALGNTRCFEGAQVVETELSREQNRMKLLLDLTNCLVSRRCLEDMLHAAAVLLRQIFQCDAAGIMLPGVPDERSHISTFDYSECDGLAISEDSYPWKQLFRCVLETRGPWSGDAKDIPLHVRQGPPYRMPSPVRNICGFPLNRPDRTLGVLALGRLSEKAFTADDLILLAEVSKQIAIALENSASSSCIVSLKDNLAHEKLYLVDEIRTELIGKEIIGESGALRSVLQKVEMVASTDSTVLICGETGTGKELIARALHNLSPRRTYPFVKLNCAAIPAGVLESELFGHEKGAFTGAIAQRIGRFEMANHGTLFLDEIGELPLELQPKLLHVLQEQSFERLGSSRTIQTNARLIAATNRDLEAMVGRKEFRLDLFYRLNVFPIQMPPLRERIEDIPLLVRSFVQRFSNRANKKVETISSSLMDALCRYDWPGNIRELQNVLERAVILSTGPVLDIPLSDLHLASSTLSNLSSAGTLNDAERKHIIAVLNETGWVLGGKNGAAERLGLKRPTLQFRMKKLGIVRPSICESGFPTQVY